MELPQNTIKNPLTIIGIFASLAEISSTAVLPLLSGDAQRIFIWFVMGFPVFLVALFFYVLITKHHVLYAPSDYKSDEAFSSLIESLRPQTPVEIQENVAEDPVRVLPDSDPQAKLRNNAILTETLVNNKLEAKYGRQYLSNMAFDLAGKKYYADGLINTQSRLSFFEIKYFQSIKTPLNGIGRTCAIFSEINNNIGTINGRLDFTIIVVTPITQPEQIELRKRLDDIGRKYNIPLVFEVWDYNQLRKESGIEGE